MEWSKTDQVFLRSLRIASTHPPPPLPRFRVEPSDKDGWYRVMDVEYRAGTQQRRLKSVIGRCDEILDPRAAAEDLAKQLNEEHAAKQRGETSS